MIEVLAVAGAAAIGGPAFGGGALGPAAPLVSVRRAATGTGLEVGAGAIARCRSGSPVEDRLIVKTKVGVGGAFLGAAKRTYRVTFTETRDVGVTTSGRVSGGRVRGAMRLVVTVRRRGRAPVRCDSGTQRWSARRVPVAHGTPGGPARGASYFGATSQKGRYLPYPLVLRVSADGARLEAGALRVRRYCTGARGDEVAANIPGAAIAPNGTFALSHRFSQRFPDSTEEYTYTFAGRFTSKGANGTIRATSVVRDSGGGRVIGRCDSRALTWTAAN